MKDSQNTSAKDAMNNAIKEEKLNDKKPVGYGSSMQNDGNGNRTRPLDLEKENANDSVKNEEQSDGDVAKGHA